MTKDVLVTISGNQFATDEGAVEVVTTGTYYMKNGKHYVLYEVQSEANGPVTKNRVKFHDGHFEMTKKENTMDFYPLTGIRRQRISISRRQDHCMWMWQPVSWILQKRIQRFP